MNEKTCKKCGQTKSLDLFYKDKYSKKDGHMSVCKECDNSYQKAWRAKIKALKETTVETPAEELVEA